MENSPMKMLRLAATTAALLLSFGAGVHAQTTLRIGLAEDPDILDPTLGRTYVGRIVFASFCDKLFDIDEKLNIVPQLALSHETSDDGKEVFIKLRPGVKFHDGEPLNAEAAKFSLDRHLTLPTSFRKPELAQLDRVDVVDPLTIKLVLKTPFSPLIAQLTDRAGMMISPKAAKEEGDKFGLKPGCARRSTCRSTARPSTRWCSTASSSPAINGSIPIIPITRRPSRCAAATSPRQ